MRAAPAAARPDGCGRLASHGRLAPGAECAAGLARHHGGRLPARDGRGADVAGRAPRPAAAQRRIPTSSPRWSGSSTGPTSWSRTWAAFLRVAPPLYGRWHAARRRLRAAAALSWFDEVNRDPQAPHGRRARRPRHTGAAGAADGGGLGAGGGDSGRRTSSYARPSWAPPSRAASSSATGSSSSRGDGAGQRADPGPHPGEPASRFARRSTRARFPRECSSRSSAD